MKIWWHKIRHWEYWPVEIVYLPTFFFWAYLVLRFKSIRFYAYSNPGIENGGLSGESKTKIYQLLPDGLYPKTVLVCKNQEKELEKILVDNQFQFPLIVKPDVGLRGVDVQRVHSLDELKVYSQARNKNFLIQELIQYPNEIGLFYYRLPSQQQGKITGITLKHFLTVKGTGKDTLEQLLLRVPRHAMQIPKLRDKLDLTQVIPAGVEQCIVPYGNHNRGTKFCDGAMYITPKLEKFFDSILSEIKGFNFGRLDIRYTDFADLENGKNFSIIELNGVASEPTHIYDPKHSFWFGQKEILRHQLIMYQVIKDNIKLQKKGKGSMD